VQEDLGVRMSDVEDIFDYLTFRLSQ